MADIQNKGIMAGRSKLRDEIRDVDLQLDLRGTLGKHTRLRARTHTHTPREKKRAASLEVLGRILESYEYDEVGAQNCLTTFARAVST